MFYLIEHNRSTKETTVAEYDNYSVAQSECFQKEQRFFHENQSEIEVVIFEADSLEGLKSTHSRYFAKAQKKENTKSALLAVGLVGLGLYLLS
jgi:pantothenate kinase